MRIQSVRIQNFRCFRDETIHFDNYTCFVGANGAGKSTVFNALNVFFRQYKDSKTDLSKLTKDDFHHKCTDDPIRITVTFTGLSEEAQKDLSTYYRHGKLVVTATATYDPSSQRAEIKQTGSRLVMDAFREFFEKEKAGSKAAELNALYAQYQKQFSDLPAAGSKDAKIAAIHAYEAARPDECSLEESDDSFYGATKGTNLMARHVQWVFVPAVKDAGEESEESKDSVLGILLARTVRSRVNFKESLDTIADNARQAYNSLLREKQSELNGVSATIQERLAMWAHPDISARVAWNEGDKSVKIEEPAATIRVGERGFEAGLVRFGHGMQRSYLFALLQMIAADGDANAPTLIMGIEEPELFQHPPQARHLGETLVELSESGSAQVMVCTHSPFFIPGDGFQHTRIARETGSPSATSITSLSYETLAAKLDAAGEKPLRPQGLLAKLWPMMNPVTAEMFFCKVLVLVEGPEDLAYIKAYLHLGDRMKEFRRYGCHIVPVMSKSCIIHPLAVATLLKIPTFVVWDADTDTMEKYVNIHKRENQSILNLLDQSHLSPWPDAHQTAKNMALYKTNLGDAIAADFDNEPFKEALNETEACFGNPGSLDKNPLKIIKHMELLWERGRRSATLEALVGSILDFAKSKAENGGAAAGDGCAAQEASVIEKEATAVVA